MALRLLDSYRYVTRVFIGALLSALWYAGHAWLSRYAGTCTMGDTDRFVVGALAGAPAGVLAVVLLSMWRPRTRSARASLLVPLLLAFVPMVLYAPLAVSAGLGGHHLCGPEFDAYRSASSAWERFIPVLHVALGAAIVLSVGRSWVRSRPVHVANVDG